MLFIFLLFIRFLYTLSLNFIASKNNNIVPFPNGNFLTKQVYYNHSKEEYVSLTNEGPFTIVLDSKEVL